MPVSVIRFTTISEETSDRRGELFTCLTAVDTLLAGQHNNQEEYVGAGRQAFQMPGFVSTPEFHILR